MGRLRALSLRPTEYVTRQMRFTPYPTEDVGWIIEQSGPDVCLFSSDYPHVEGGSDPFGRFTGQLERFGTKRSASSVCIARLPGRVPRSSTATAVPGSTPSAISLSAIPRAQVTPI